MLASISSRLVSAAPRALASQEVSPVDPARVGVYGGGLRRHKNDKTCGSRGRTGGMVAGESTPDLGFYVEHRHRPTRETAPREAASGLGNVSRIRTILRDPPPPTLVWLPQPLTRNRAVRNLAVQFPEKAAGSPHHETHLPAECTPSKAQARLPSAHAHSRRPRRPSAPPAEGPRASLRLAGAHSPRCAHGPIFAGFAGTAPAVVAGA